MDGPKVLLALAFVVSTLGVSACGDDDDDGGTTTGAEQVGTTAGGDETGASEDEGGEPIVIKTHVAAPEGPDQPTTGEVRPGSTIGDSAFCSEGTFRDAPVKPPSEEIVRLFSCPEGSLTISFTPTGSSLKQSSDWKVVRGSGSLEDLSGGGRMTAVFESSRPDAEGRETFEGTATR